MGFTQTSGQQHMSGEAVSCICQFIQEGYITWHHSIFRWNMWSIEFSTLSLPPLNFNLLQTPTCSSHSFNHPHDGETCFRVQPRLYQETKTTSSCCHLSASRCTEDYFHPGIINSHTQSVLESECFRWTLVLTSELWHRHFQFSSSSSWMSNRGEKHWRVYNPRIYNPNVDLNKSASLNGFFNKYVHC